MIRTVDAYRLHAIAPDGRLIAYALLDAYGWAAFSRHRGKVRKVGRFTDTAKVREWLKGVAAMSG